MAFNPTRQEINEAWEALEAGHPVSADMRQILNKLNQAVASGTQELKEEALYQRALGLSAQYDQLVTELAAMPDRVLSRLNAKFAHVSRAAYGKRTRDYNQSPATVRQTIDLEVIRRIQDASRNAPGTKALQTPT